MRKNITEETGTQQANPPIMATSFLDNPIAPMLTEQAPFPIGLETHSLLSLSVSFNETFGEWQYLSELDDVDLIYPESGKAQSVNATQLYMDRLNEANSGEIDAAWLRGGLTSHFTYHPLGGAVLGKASDLYGRLKGYNNLYCLDGSMIPGNAVANPSLLIAALAERAMDDILAKDIV
jgi:cholesterol oxidase